MVGNSIYQGIKYGRDQIYFTTKRPIFAERRDELVQSWNEEIFSSLDQVFLMCEMVEPTILRSEQVACASAVYKNVTEKIEKEVVRTRWKGHIWGWGVSCKRQEYLRKSDTKLMVRLAWYNHQRKRRNNTYNYTLHHICKEK